MIQRRLFNRNSLQRCFKPVRTLWGQSSLRDLTFYELRHSTISWWGEIGVNEATAAAWVGWP